MAKKVFYDDDARRRVLEGAQALYDAVKVTMGPKGRNVVISKTYGNPTITHDGVTVAKEIEFPENDDETLGYSVGAEMIKEAANKMNDVAGDGTTTVTVLTYHILNEANRLVAAGHNPMELRKGIEEAGAEVLERLGKMSENIGSKKERVAEVATISAGDEKIGAMIADVIKRVGKDGVVTVEEGQGLEMESEVVEGFTMDRGFVSPYMVTDATRMEAVYDRPLILITDKKLSSVAEVMPLLGQLAQAKGKSLVIIADEIDGEALSALVFNKVKGVLDVVAVKAPAFGDRRREVLEDIAVLAGTRVVKDGLEDLSLDELGGARRVTVTKGSTTIIEGAGTEEDVNPRLKQLDAQIEGTSSEYDGENLRKRRADLSGKVAVLKIGGATETEIEEKKYRVDDAVAAVKAALKEGVLPGGGVALVEIAETVDNDIVANALRQPFKHLMDNAGLVPEVMLADVQQAKAGMGVDVTSGKLLDMKAAGILDPTRVAKEAVRSAISIAATIITMGALAVEVPEASDD